MGQLLNSGSYISYSSTNSISYNPGITQMTSLWHLQGYSIDTSRSLLQYHDHWAALYEMSVFVHHITQKDTNFYQMCDVLWFVHALQIIQRYDIILIQEVRDSDLLATNKLMEHVNELDTLILYMHILKKDK